jgi:hypothetical protein
MSVAKISALESRLDELEKKFAALMVEKAEKADKSTDSATGGKAKTKAKTTGEKVEKVKRAPSGWSLFMKHVTSEMKAADPEGKLSLPAIAGEAKKRKEAGSYDEAHWKEMASKLSV